MFNRKFKTKNYFLSRCIVNLGVVPWFLLEALRFVPIFFNLLERLFFVTLVRETILKLQKVKNLLNLDKLNLISNINSSVKFVLLMISISSSLVHGKTNNTAEYYLTIGEHKLISMNYGDKYIIGNKNIINAKKMDNGKRLLIQGNHLGFSEILIFSNKLNSKNKRLKPKRKKNQKVIKIHVINKRTQEKSYYLSRQLTNLGLSTKFTGKTIICKGIVKNIAIYRQILKLIENHPTIISDEVYLTKELKQKLLTKTYSRFFNEYIENLDCSFDKIKMICLISKNHINASLVKYYKHKFHITFIPTEKNWQNKNYRITLRLIEAERKDGKDLNWGISKINIALNDLHNNNWKSLLQQQLNLKLGENILNSLSTPSISIVENEETTIKLGTEIPFDSTNANGTTKKEWKFVGFQLKAKLNKKNDNVLFSYTTQLDRPINNKQVNSSKQTSVIIVPIGKTINAFEINYQIDNSISDVFPIIGKIPYLGVLFNSSHTTKSYKKLIGLITISYQEN